ALEGHRAAAPGVGGLDLGAREAERGQQVEAGIGERGRGDTEALGAEGLAKGPFVEGEFDVEGGGESGFEGGEGRFVKAFRSEALMVDVRRAIERATAQRVARDRGE